MKIRKEVMWFARRMELKLRENDHKDHWTGCDFEYLFRRLMEESTELHAAFLDDQIDEAADVANFAMMIADNARGYLPPLPVPISAPPMMKEGRHE